MKPNKTIVQSIESESFSLFRNKIFQYKPQRLYKKEFDNCLSFYYDKLGEVNRTSSELFMLYKSLYAKIQSIEKPIKEKLEQLASDTIRKLYDIPAQINLNSKIINESEINFSEPQLQLSELTYELKEEIHKRVILNSVVNGSSVHIWKSICFLIKDDIDKLNPNLFELYVSYSALVNYILWQQDASMNNINNKHIQKNGICDIDFKNFTLNSNGVNFQVLLLETNKVALHYLTCNAIPKHFNENELRTYYYLADNYQDEFWHNLLSPTIWIDLLETAQINSDIIPKLIHKLTSLNNDKLTELFILIQQEDKTKALNIIKSWNLTY